MIVYHGTSAGYRASIERAGLRGRPRDGAFVSTAATVAVRYATERVAAEAFESMSPAERERVFDAIRAQARGERAGGGVSTHALLVTLDVPRGDLILDPEIVPAGPPGLADSVQPGWYQDPCYYRPDGFPSSMIVACREFVSSATVDPSSVVWCWAGHRWSRNPADPLPRRVFEWLNAVFGVRPTRDLWPLGYIPAFDLENGRASVPQRSLVPTRRTRPRPLGFPAPRGVAA